ncbi:hypothetical protein R4Y45_00740 [Holzapfeliella sp. He02]|uniref:Uncharacterized protein n=1 Tax=Holzapfeliella saturejae TaxID=3082953 RepID=A0ABU8SEH6_9LACO
MNKRVLTTVFIYITIIVLLLLSMIISLNTASRILKTKSIEQQFGQSHILDLKDQLSSKQQTINTSNNNEPILLSSHFYAIKSDKLETSGDYHNIKADLSIFNTSNHLVGHFTVLNSFFVANNHVSIVDITNVNSELQPWFIQYGGYGPALKTNYNVTASFSFQAWISSFSEKDFTITANTTLNVDKSHTIEWVISDFY